LILSIALQTKARSERVIIKMPYAQPSRHMAFRATDWIISFWLNYSAGLRSIVAGIGWGIVADMAQHVRCNNIVEMKPARSPIVAVILAFGSLPAVKLVASGLALVALSQR
jgi:hypothetical protein